MKLVTQYFLVVLFAVLRKVVYGVAMASWLARCTLAGVIELGS